jgi:hypothetical protein
VAQLLVLERLERQQYTVLVVVVVGLLLLLVQPEQ